MPSVLGLPPLAAWVQPVSFLRAQSCTVTQSVWSFIAIELPLQALTCLYGGASQRGALLARPKRRGRVETQHATTPAMAMMTQCDVVIGTLRSLLRGSCALSRSCPSPPPLPRCSSASPGRGAGGAPSRGLRPTLAQVVMQVGPPLAPPLCTFLHPSMHSARCMAPLTLQKQPGRFQSYSS